jgi:ankyrin repeat protein
MGCNLNAQNNVGEAAIHGAALKGHYLFIERLVEFGASVRLRDYLAQMPSE